MELRAHQNGGRANQPLFRSKSFDAEQYIIDMTSILPIGGTMHLLQF